jgi:hypothetical protein
MKHIVCCLDSIQQSNTNRKDPEISDSLFADARRVLQQTSFINYERRLLMEEMRTQRTELRVAREGLAGKVKQSRELRRNETPAGLVQTV